jgi:hypothetical protein
MKLINDLNFIIEKKIKIGFCEFNAEFTIAIIKSRNDGGLWSLATINTAIVIRYQCITSAFRSSSSSTTATTTPPSSSLTQCNASAAS